jgi:glutamine synthetase
LPDPSCNVYAALAATLAAGLHGLDAGMKPAAPSDSDLYEALATGAAMPERLPADLGAALRSLACDKQLLADLGVDFCNEFIRLKNREWDEYCLHVSDWELQRYADGF